MTALNEYQRLEASGLWRATPEKQRRDVIVSLGDATLKISDTAEMAISHWSLPAVHRMNPGELPAIYRPGPDAEEELELTDEAMIAALAKVHGVIKKRKAHPGRLRHLLIGGGAAVLLGLVFFWLPDALIRQTTAVVPAAKRAEIGRDLLENIRRVSGPRCGTDAGERALGRLKHRLLGREKGEIVILSAGVRTAEHLPGGIIILNRALVEDFEDPEVVAGFVLAEDERARRRDPLELLLRTTGLRSAFTLLTTGEIRDEVLARYAEDLLTRNPAPLPDEALLERFAAAKVRSTPYAFALDISGEETLPLIEADPIAPAAAEAILRDGEWVGLQGICGD